MMVKLVRYGHPRYGVPMYSITMFKSYSGGYIVEVSPCDSCGQVVSDPIAWNTFASRWSARKYMKNQYREMYRYVNHR